MLIAFLVSAVVSLQGTQRLATTRDPRRSRFRSSSEPTIYTAANARGVLAGVRELVDRSDSVLEIGCQLGSLTRALVDSAAHVDGVDIARETRGSSGRTSSYRSHATAEAAGLTGMTFSLVDPWDTYALKESVGGQPSVAVIDVTVTIGNDLPLEAVALCRRLAATFPSLNRMIIKSRSVDKLRRQLVTLPSLQAEVRVAPRSWLPRIVATKGVADYRTAALSLVRTWSGRGQRSIRALEIGCHRGTSMALLH